MPNSALNAFRLADKGVLRLPWYLILIKYGFYFILFIFLRRHSNSTVVIQGRESDNLLINITLGNQDRENIAGCYVCFRYRHPQGICFPEN